MPNRQAINNELEEKKRIAAIRKEKFLKHFLVDFMDYSLQKSVNDNALFCAEQAGYFERMDKQMTKKDYRQADVRYEHCLGKFSDSYETTLAAFVERLGKIKQPILHKHDQPLGNKERSNQALIGSMGLEEPIYEIPMVRKHTKP